jgi:S-methylmethionine-dependent homocysteine/selenocysteine methylase
MAHITLLDGGIGQEINKRSMDVTHPLWSLKVMFDTPEIVVDVYKDFIAAGAKVICLNTYTATPTRMRRDGYGQRFKEAHRTAIALAKQAIAESAQEGKSVQIAGCLPPLVASYLSEHHKSYGDSLAEYLQIVDLEKDFVDVFLIETMSNIEEASAALDAVKETSVPVYVGLTLSDDLSDTLRSGESLEDALIAIASKEPDGIMLNCSVPEAITKAMPKLAATGIKFGGYANAFTAIENLTPGGTVDVLEARTDLSPQAYTDFALQWIAAGASIVGGCCEVGPDHINHLANKLIEQGHVVTNFN